jgi:hypothetical protein
MAGASACKQKRTEDIFPVKARDSFPALAAEFFCMSRTAEALLWDIDISVTPI